MIKGFSVKTIRPRSLLPFAFGIGAALFGCNSCDKQRKIAPPVPTSTSAATTAAARPAAKPLAKPAEVAPVHTAPSLGTLLSKCLNLPKTPINSLSQLGCLVGGTKSAREKINEARSAYLKLFGQNLEKGTIILRKPKNDAVSEGIGFGGVLFGVSGGLAAAGLALSGGNSQENQHSFWQLYNARNAYFLQENGVMAWLVNADGSVQSTDSASDGDQDWIASELIVLNQIQCGKWQMPSSLTLQSFRAQIQKDVNAFWKNHVRERNGRLVFLPSNGSWARRGDGRDVYYASYPDPHFLGLFAEFDPAHDWRKLADDVQNLNQTILNNHQNLGASGQNPMPAKVFVKVNSNGRFLVENYYEISRNEGIPEVDLVDNELDSIRFLLRMARAAVMDGDRSAKKISQQLLTIANISGPSSAHILAKSKGAPSPLGFNNTLARASYGIAVLGSGDASKAERFFCTVMNDHQGQFFGEWDGAKNYYYDQSLILQILDLAFIYNN
ncbi:MAG: hypothetical protein ABIH22_02110 [Candidatus Margulisiibacteriota bacterium]